MLMFIYPARYFAVFLGTSWRHRVLRVSRKAKHTLKLTLFRAWNVTAYPYEFCLFWPPTLINNDKYLVGGLEHGFYDFPFSWECHHRKWRAHIFQRGRAQPPTSYCYWKHIKDISGIAVSGIYWNHQPVIVSYCNQIEIITNHEPSLTIIKHH